MRTILLKTPISKAFQQDELQLTDEFVTFEFFLFEGKKIVQTEPLKIGSYGHLSIYAMLSLGYSYNPLLHEVNIAGIDSSSEQQLKIHTFLELDEQMAYTHSIQAPRQQTKANSWSAIMERNLSLKKSMEQLIKDAIQSIINQLLAAGINSVSLSTSAPIITLQNFQDYYALLFPDKLRLEKPRITDILTLQNKINAIFDDAVAIKSSTAFANVIGSTADKKEDRLSWIKLWMETCNSHNIPAQCASLNLYIPNSYSYACSYSRFQSKCFGGHVILATQAQLIQPYKDSQAVTLPVYIAPICVTHNNHDDVYMENNYNQNQNTLLIARLNNYLC